MNQLVTFVICAYNEPELLQRAMESILKQTYRPLEIIVSDDNSPNLLEETASKYKNISNVNIVYTRNNRNLRPYWNNHSTRRLIRGRFVMYMPHDDFLLDSAFVETSVKIMTSQENCHVVIANSLLEDTKNLMMDDDTQEIRMINGNKFLMKNLWEKLHPSYSAVIFDNHKLLQKKYDSFTLGENEMKKMNLEPDEWFLSIVLCAEDSEVAISGRPVSVRGNPANSFSKSEYWGAKWRECCFLPQYQIIKYFKQKNKNQEAKAFENMLEGKYSLPKINWQILAYLNFELNAIKLMVWPILKAKYFIRTRGLNI